VKVKGMRVFSYIWGVYCAAMTMLALTHIDVTSFMWWAFYAPHAAAIVILGSVAYLLDPASDITKSKELRSGIKDEEGKMMTEFKTLKDIVEQLKDCGYECEAGPLVNNVAFQKLAAMAEVDVESGEEIYYVEQADHKEDN
jgi:hypothetical protein